MAGHGSRERARGSLPVLGGIDSRLDNHLVTGNQQRGTPLTVSLTSYLLGDVLI